MSIDLAAKPAPEGETPDPDAAATAQATKFLSMITEREKELEKGWWKGAEEAERIYNVDKRDDAVNQSIPYNILYSNTEVLLPSLFSGQPKPDVRARFPGTDLGPIPDACERFLTIFSDGASPGFESFDEALSATTLSSLVPGGGVVRLRRFEGEAFPLRLDNVYYRNFIPAKSKKWSKTPWIAFKHEMSRDAMKSQLDIEPEEYEENYAGEDKESKASICVYEFWHKATRQVWFISDEWQGKVVSPAAEDPLKLAGFFPTPGYLCLTKLVGKAEPISLYTYYQQQATELNVVTVRLKRVISAIKARGVYNSLLGTELENMLSDDTSDNMLIPAKEAGLLAQNGGFDKQIWFLPIEKLVQVLQQLYVAREAIKQVIYEITGISDIIRGSSVASETATAQDLKNKWGTVRLRKMQTIVGNYVRDLYRMAVDAGAAVVPAEEWKKICQMPLPLAAEKQAAQKQIQIITEQHRMANPAPVPGMAPQGPPPPPPPIPPQVQQAANSPSWEEVLAKISSDVDRVFTINIQTDSTVDLDTASDKKEVTEFMNSLAQLLGGLQPLAQLGPQGIAASKEIVIAVCQKFKFGIPIADILKKMDLTPPPQGDDAKMQAEMQLEQAKHQMEMEKLKFEREEAQMKHQMEIKKMQLEMQKIQVQTDAIIQKAQAQAMVKMTPQAPAPAKPEGAQNANV